MRIFDTHAHYSDKRFDEDRCEVLTKLRASGVELVADVACDLRSVEKTLELLDRYDFMYGVFGMHPHYAEYMTNELLDGLKKLLARRKAVALGEIGLDYYYDFSPREKQIEWFDRQLSLAAELNKPVILHIRDAMGDCLDVLRAHAGEIKTVGGIMHCFSGSVEIMREAVSLGLYIGFGGAVTFKNAKKAVAVAKEVPSDRLLLETDCPYMAPTPFRGKRNTSMTIRPNLITLWSAIFRAVSGGT